MINANKPSVPSVTVTQADSEDCVRGIISDLQGRGGIKPGFDNIDEEIRAEIVESLAAIIRAAHQGAGEP